MTEAAEPQDPSAAERLDEMTEPEEPYNPSPAERASATDVILAEYSALRQEIGRYQDHQKQIMNFVVLVVGGTLAIVVPGVAKLNADHNRVLDIFLIVPIFCCLLCLLYYDRTIRILRLAHYLATVSNRNASRVSGVLNVWKWERYKRTTTIVNRRLALWVDRVRWLMFILPSCAFPALFFTFGGQFKGNRAGLIYLIIDTCVILGTTVLVMKIEETHGVNVGEADLG